MTRKAAYRAFLKSEFWVELSARKRALVCKCERCGSRNRLQSHHHTYPADWYQTTLEHLTVLCRRCHGREHGIVISRFFQYRKDERFNAFVHRCGCLMRRLIAGRGSLRARDIAFLDYAEYAYRPKKKDTAMQLQVRLVRQFNEMYRKGELT